MDNLQEISFGPENKRISTDLVYRQNPVARNIEMGNTRSIRSLLLILIILGGGGWLICSRVGCCQNCPQKFNFKFNSIFSLK